MSTDHCHACRAEIKNVRYDCRVQQRSRVGDSFQPTGPAVDLCLCLKCVCGINSYALPLALNARNEALQPPHLITEP